MRIETENLIIRNFVLSDEDDLCEYMMQRVNALYERYADFTKDSSREEIENRSKSDEFFAIELKSENKVIGNIYMGKRNFNSRELGYVLNENYQHKGFGTEAAKAAVDYFFEQGIHRIYAECCPDNTQSWKVMEKIGMRREAWLRDNVSFYQDDNGNPIYWDTYVYGLINSNDLKNSKKNDSFHDIDIELKKIDLKNIWSVCKMDVKPEQGDFIAPNIDSILQAYATRRSGYVATPFGIYHKDKLIGFVMFKYDSNDEEDPEVARGNYCMWRFMIDAKYQGLGLGQKAVETCIRYVKTFPCGEADSCWLSYRRENEKAKNIYQSFGFEENGEMYGDEVVAVLSLKL